MPLVDRRSGLTPANARNADVAHHLTEHIAPMQQQKMQAAFRVQGIQGILYHRLTQGRPCICSTKTAEINSRLNGDGKALPGAIETAITGTRFGVRDYGPSEVLDISGSNRERINSIQEKVAARLDDEFDLLEEDEVFADNGNVNAIDDLLDGLDLTTLGFSDVSCPICFGSKFVGGYSLFRGWREVAMSTEMGSSSNLDTLTMKLNPGTHEFSVVLPRSVSTVDVFRAMDGSNPIPAQVFIDGRDVTRCRLSDFFTGVRRTIKIVTSHMLSHFEMQAATSLEPIYFEVPKRTKSNDLSVLDATQPFQIVVSPDVPQIAAYDVIAENQKGKILVVQAATPWHTRHRNMLGYEVEVRVAQPQELWNILPFRLRVTGQKRVRGAAPTNDHLTSGLSKLNGLR